jgi:WD40 repeat protein
MNYSSSRVLKGPETKLKTVVVFRTVLQEDYKLCCIYTGLFLVDTTSPTLQHRPLTHKILPLEEKVRDVAVSPNGKDLLIVYQNQIEKYTFERSIDNGKHKYQLKLLKQANLTQSLAISDVNYHPRGSFVIGVACETTTSPMYTPIKINATSLEL